MFVVQANSVVLTVIYVVYGHRIFGFYAMSTTNQQDMVCSMMVAIYGHTYTQYNGVSVTNHVQTGRSKI